MQVFAFSLRLRYVEYIGPPNGTRTHNPHINAAPKRLLSQVSALTNTATDAPQKRIIFSLYPVMSN